MSLSNSSIEILNRAKSYPFWLPDYSYIFYNGSHYNFQISEKHSLESSQIYWKEQWISIPSFYAENKLDGVEELSERIPVLACGSNGSPHQLARKFANLDGAIIPVLKAKMLDFDVVYCPLFSPYGSIPATMYYSPGTAIDTFINYLTPSQLETMHETEGLGFSYSFAKLDRVQLTLENNRTLNEIRLYLSWQGCLCLNDSLVSLAAIPAENRQFTPMNEVQILNAVRGQIAPNQELDNFILENVEDRTVRKQRIQQLEQTAKPFNYPHYQILLP